MHTIHTPTTARHGSYLSQCQRMTGTKHQILCELALSFQRNSAKYVLKPLHYLQSKGYANFSTFQPRGLNITPCNLKQAPNTTGNIALNDAKKRVQRPRHAADRTGIGLRGNYPPRETVPY